MLKPTDEESADLKQRLRTLPVTAEIRAEAEAFPAETSEALEETERGLIPALPGSYVAVVLAAEKRIERKRIERLRLKLLAANKTHLNVE